MQVASDLIHLPYTPDLAQAGQVYACRALCRGQVSLGRWPFQDLKTLAARAVAELAFRRHLYAERVPHTNQCLSPLFDPDRAHPVIGQRRCDLVNQCLTRPETVQRLGCDPSRLLAFGARIPFAQAPSYLLTGEDLFIFSFVLAPALPSSLALQAGPSLHPMPKHWARLDPEGGPGPLRITSNSDQEVVFELGGLGPDRQVLNEALRLQPGQPCSLATNFATLAYLQRDRPYQGTVSIYSAGFQQTYRVTGSSWGSIQLNGRGVILAGYITRSDYFQKAELIQSQPEKPNQPLIYTLPIQQLHPLTDLFERARAWAEEN